jgi:hypothetical protein
MCAWDKTKPGNVKMRVGRQQILDNNAALETALQRNHNFPGTAGADDGEHIKVTFHAPIAKPANEANKGFLYIKDVSGVAELHFEDEAGNEIQLTTGGLLNIAGAMLLAGAQTVTGAKTFQAAITMSGANIVMAGAETVDGRDVSVDGAAVDDHETRISALESTPGFGAWATKSNNTVYQATTDGFVIAFKNSGGNLMYGYTDGSNPPTTAIAAQQTDAWGDEASFTMPVRSGDYWKVTGATNVFWIPLGS